MLSLLVHEATPAYSSARIPASGAESERVDCKRRTSAMRKQVTMRLSAFSEGSCGRLGNISEACCLRMNGMSAGEGVIGVGLAEAGDVLDGDASEGGVGGMTAIFVGSIFVEVPRGCESDESRDGEIVP